MVEQAEKLETGVDGSPEGSVSDESGELVLAWFVDQSLLVYIIAAGSQNGEAESPQKVLKKVTKKKYHCST